tara:strand:+ start:453 stop:593 length:141 start_codon:yes stop_codon:yes gene_type:complete
MLADTSKTSWRKPVNKVIQIRKRRKKNMVKKKFDYPVLPIRFLNKI